MTSTTADRSETSRARTVSHLAGPSLVVGGVAFFLGGMTHPSDAGEGNKVMQLHGMLVHSSWYPSHGLLLVATALFATGIFAIRQRPDLTPGMEQLLKVAFVVACVATASMAVHLLAALDADSLADGKHSVTSRIQAVNETIGAAWGLTMAAVAVRGGLTRTVGNRLTIPFGLVGGVAFALASGTIAYTDTFDPLFKIGSLLAVWAILSGAIETLRRSPTWHRQQTPDLRDEPRPAALETR